MKMKLIITIALTAILISCHSKQNNTGPVSKSQSDSSALKQATADLQHGRQLFKQRCNTCHVAPETNVADQVSFVRLFDRLPPPPEEYFVKYIQDSRLLKSSGNEYSNRIDKAWNSDYEHYFKDSLSQQDFSDLIIYIKVAAKQKDQ